MPWYAILVAFAACLVAGWLTTRIPAVCRAFGGSRRSTCPELMAIGIAILLMACVWPIVCGIMGWT